MAPYQPIGTGYKPIGTGYKPIGAGYNRAGPNTGYGFTGTLEEIKSNNLFKGDFNNQTAPQSAMFDRPQPVMSNPTQYLTGSQQSPAQNILTGISGDAYDSVRDVNGNGMIDPWEM